MIGLANSAWAKIFVLVFAVWFWTYSSYGYATLYDHLFSTSSDFSLFYAAGQLWLAGANPYTPSTLPQHFGQVFIYPPTSLPFYGTFALFSWPLAVELWTATYVAVFLVAMLGLAFTLKGERRLILIGLAVILSLTSYPLLILMQLSQSDLLITSLTVLSLVLLRIRRDFASSALLSLAVLLKGSAIFLLIYFVIFRRDLEFLRYFILSTLLFVAASLPAVPIHLYSYYLTNILPAQFNEYQMSSCQTVIHFLYLAGLSRPLLEVVAVAGIGLFAVFAFIMGASEHDKSPQLNSIRHDGFFLLNGLILLLFNPKALIYPYVWVILPLALFLSSILEEDVRLTYLALIGFATCFLCTAEATPILSLFIYPMTLPTILIGNIIMIASLVPMYLWPNTIIPSLKASNRKPKPRTNSHHINRPPARRDA